MLIKDPPAEIANRLLMLGTNEYPLYLFRGGSYATVFEGGTGPMGPLLVEQLDRLDINMDSIRQVVITHAHPDHVMAVPRLREMIPDITVFASDAAAKTLSSPEVIALFCQIDEALTNSLLKAGSITEAHRPPPLGEEQIVVDRTVKEGDAITIDPGTSLTVLATPGHSECSLSFHDPQGHLLIISDATGFYVPEHEWWWPNYLTDYGAYVDSMERLAELEAEVLCLSHNAVIEGAEEVKAYFHGAIAATREYHDRIVSEAREGTPARQIAEQLGSEVYEKTQLLPLDFFQKNCGLLVKHSLRHAGLGAKK